VTAAARRLDARRRGVGVGEFDVISGLTGVGAYLLARRSEHTALITMLRCLVDLVLDDASPPRWYTPADFLGDDDQRRRYPNGNFNCGLAHGLPGPLALLSLAASEGVQVARLGEAVNEAARWLAEHRIDDEWGPTWPNAVAVAAAGTTATPQTELTRASWCYGTPGIARALWLAGDAIDDDGHRQLGINAMAGIFRRPPRLRGLFSPTLCHGAAGLLQVTLRFAQDTGLAVFRQGAVSLLEEILDAYAPGSLLGYRNIEPGDVGVDQPGLLDGAPGVALTLLTAASPADCGWDRILLLT
jgi:hypothetical protein